MSVKTKFTSLFGSSEVDIPDSADWIVAGRQCGECPHVAQIIEAKKLLKSVRRTFYGEGLISGSVIRRIDQWLKKEVGK
jgi:hypothetical protein